MHVLEVVHGGHPTQIEGVFPGPFVTGTFALKLVNTGEGIFYTCPLPQGLAALRCMTRRTQLDQ